MTGTAANPDAAPQPAPLTVAQAKANLLAQGEAAQLEVEQLVERAKVDVHEVIGGVRKVIPWAAAAALGAGLLMGRKGRHRVAGSASEKLRWLAATLGPLAWDLFLKSRGGRGAG